MLGKRINELPQAFAGTSGDMFVLRKTDGKEYKIDWDVVAALASAGAGIIPGRVVSLDFTISESDLGQFVEATNPIEITIPSEASEDLPQGFVIHGYNHSNGAVTFDDTAVTLVVNGDLASEIPPGGCFTLMKSRVASDTWIIYGYLALSEA